MSGRKSTKIQYSNIVGLPSGTGYTPQSLAFINEDLRIIACSGSTPNQFLSANKSKATKLGKHASVGHANGATYCPANGNIYVCTGNGNHNVWALDTSCNLKFTVKLPTSCSGIAYDVVTGNFYVSSGTKIYIYPADAFAKGGSWSGKYGKFTKKFTNDGRNHQDIGGHNGVVMVCRSSEGKKDQTSYIDCYDAGNGNYLKSYHTTWGELESVAVDSNGFMHVLFAQDRKIIISKTRFDLVGTGGGNILGALGASGEIGALALVTSPDKLYSSSNYLYVEKEEKDTSQLDSLKTNLKEILSSNTLGALPDTPANNRLILSLSPDKSTRPKTKLKGEVFGPSLPVALDPVEAPFIELTIGGYTFGTYDSLKIDKFPNYVDSMNIIKTNGSLNQYTINLVHQVRPGSNPNFIDELLSANGYKQIIISYGDANSNVKFTDSNALLTGVNVNFDFVNCNIKYTIKATSSAIAIASHKRNFASITDKPSNVIRNLLYNDSSEDLLNAFPAMRDKNFVEKNNLIPTTDSIVTIEEFKNINAFSYVKNLVSCMTNGLEEAIKNTFMMSLGDGYFSIQQVSTNYVYDAQLYEVNINYLDDSQIFNFNMNTDYSWPLAYNYSGSISNYNYDIKSNGKIKTYTTNSSNLLDYSSSMETNVNDNWWTQVTEFPVSATLNCRGLLSPLLLLTYIKVNCVYYGGQRLSSGVYIVTGQEDSLSGAGFKTTLSLLRVAGPQQHLTVDGRVKT